MLLCQPTERLIFGYRYSAEAGLAADIWALPAPSADTQAAIRDVAPDVEVPCIVLSHHRHQRVGRRPEIRLDAIEQAARGIGSVFASRQRSVIGEKTISVAEGQADPDIGPRGPQIRQREALGGHPEHCVARRKTPVQRINDDHRSGPAQGIGLLLIAKSEPVEMAVRSDVAHADRNRWQERAGPTSEVILI